MSATMMNLLLPSTCVCVHADILSMTTGIKMAAYRFLDNVESPKPLVDKVVRRITDHHETIHTRINNIYTVNKKWQHLLEAGH